MKRTKRVLREAADLLACCASQRDLRPIVWMDGKWSGGARDLAGSEWDAAHLATPMKWNWRLVYAEAEARLREEIANMGGKRR